MSVALTSIVRGVVVLSTLALIAVPVAAQAEPSEVRWGVRIEVASGAAHRGPWRMNESEYDFVDDATVAINERNIVAVAWADHSRQDIFFQVYEPDGRKRFQAPVKVSRSPRVFSWLPKMVIASGAAREVYILWQEIVFSGGSHGGEIFFARSTDGGKNFTEPINLSNSTAGDGKGRTTPRRWHNGSLDLASGPRGELYAAWTEYQGKLWFSRSTDGGAHFSEPLRVAGGRDSDPARGPSLAVDAKGIIHLAWTVGEDKAADIRIAKSVDRGRSFGEPRIVFDSDGHSDAPKIAVDSKGTIHLVYAESPAGPFERYHIRYARLNDAGQASEEPMEISSPQTAEFASLGFPGLSLDGEDNIYVIWEIFPRLGYYSQGLGFTYSSAGGRGFASPSIVPGSLDRALGFSGSQQGLLMRKLAVNETGAVAVVNSTFKKSRMSLIRLYRGLAAGN